MILACTRSVNTGGKILKMWSAFKGCLRSSISYSSPSRFVDCQHHVLSQILLVVMDDEPRRKETLDIALEMEKKYEVKSNFVSDKEEISESSIWHVKLLYLAHIFCFIGETGRYPRISFQMYFYVYFLTHFQISAMTDGTQKQYELFCLRHANLVPKAGQTVGFLVRYIYSYNKYTCRKTSLKVNIVMSEPLQGGIVQLCKVARTL